MAGGGWRLSGRRRGRRLGRRRRGGRLEVKRLFRALLRFDVTTRARALAKADAEVVAAGIEKHTLVERIGLRNDATIGAEGALDAALHEVLLKLRCALRERLRRELVRGPVGAVALLRDRRERRRARRLLGLTSRPDGQAERLGARCVAKRALEMTRGLIEILRQVGASAAIELFGGRLEALGRRRLVRIRGERCQRDDPDDRERAGAKLPHPGASRNPSAPLPV